MINSRFACFVYFYVLMKRGRPHTIVENGNI